MKLIILGIGSILLYTAVHWSFFIVTMDGVVKCFPNLNLKEHNVIGCNITLLLCFGANINPVMYITTFGDTSDQQITLYELYHTFWEQQKKELPSYKYLLI